MSRILLHCGLVAHVVRLSFVALLSFRCWQNFDKFWTEAVLPAWLLLDCGGCQGQPLLIAITTTA
jgi:hypothetical protein